MPSSNSPVSEAPKPMSFNLSSSSGLRSPQRLDEITFRRSAFNTDVPAAPGHKPAQSMMIASLEDSSIVTFLAALAASF